MLRAGAAILQNQIQFPLGPPEQRTNRISRPSAPENVFRGAQARSIIRARALLFARPTTMIADELGQGRGPSLGLDNGNCKSKIKRSFVIPILPPSQVGRWNEPTWPTSWRATSDAKASIDFGHVQRRTCPAEASNVQARLKCAKMQTDKMVSWVNGV